MALEITETMLMDGIEKAVLTLDALHELGVALAIDNFGSPGLSSLNYHVRLPIDQVKVDHSFVSDIPRNVHAMAITTAVIAVARLRLDLSAVAEAREPGSSRHFLGEHGCEFGQGYSCPGRRFRSREQVQDLIRVAAPCWRVPPGRSRETLIRSFAPSGGRCLALKQSRQRGHRPEEDSAPDRGR
ncbi:MAG: EAL domain-containing protein [Gammaproteobacteria bacterium]|nr:EAL domain-containing protein [Gammaproteobacteria bacterium]